MNKYIYVFLLLLTCFGLCQCRVWGSTRIDICSEAINTAQKKACEILCKRYGIVVGGSGVGSPSNVVKSLSLHFYVSRPLDKEEAVRILADCSQELVKQANASKVLRQFMENYPFTLRNIEMSLEIHRKDRSEIQAPGLSYISLYADGSIGYYVSENGKSILYEYPETIFQVIDRIKHKNESEK